ncbi:PD-(D/E)XK motif protein [Microbacterium sulfonylureivorans]|uniref:PD-(D/E)XK motif protein n=1 Tax=Microbacterium sulfonylureivorans TaxID=2486854 RepID=UPI000FD78125|nr:PD-(D/E)XK motif protein [Microbacterium sulfonylureivorans]
MDARIAEVLTKQSLQLLPIAHPVLTVYAQNVDGRPAIVVDVQGTVDRYIAGSKGVAIVVDGSGDDQTYVRFESVASGRTPMFEALIDSLLESTLDAKDPATALDVMVDTFDEFKAMLASDHGQLSESSVRGLFAELVLLRDLRDAGFDPATALAAWHGPYRAAKDFVLPDEKCVEVKSIRRQNHRLQISNIDQLDPRGEDLRLAVLELDRRVDGEGTSLESLINELEVWVSVDPQAKGFFAQALAAVGIDLSDPYYRQWRFDIGSWHWYAILEDFPRVRAAFVPPPITRVRYAIDIDQCQQFATVPFWTPDTSIED